MKDIEALNYHYLLLARDMSSSSLGKLITGLPKDILDRLADMDMDEIRELAASIGVSMVNIRFSEDQMTKMLNMPNSYRKHYAVSVCSRER